MKKIKLFFALFAMLALGVGNAWGAETLVKVSSADLVDGDYLITATKSGSEYFLSAATFDAGKSTAAKLETDYSHVWSFTKQSDGTWLVKLSTGDELGVTNTNNGVVCSKTGGKPFTISATASGETTVYMVASDGTNNRYLTLYKTSNWRCYKTTANATSDQVRAIQLYKVTSSGGSTEPVVSLLPKFIHFWCSLFAG